MTDGKREKGKRTEAVGGMVPAPAKKRDLRILGGRSRQLCLFSTAGTEVAVAVAVLCGGGRYNAGPQDCWRGKKTDSTLVYNYDLATYLTRPGR